MAVTARHHRADANAFVMERETCRTGPHEETSPWYGCPILSGCGNGRATRLTVEKAPLTEQPLIKS